MTFDPKTALIDCDTLLLDMDGTILDLAYDNYMWMKHVPERWAEKNGMTLEEAQKYLLGKFGKAQGDLRWYCLDHWSEHLELDVAQLHRDNHHLIDFLPGARDFLKAVREADIKVIMATNSHQATLDLKHEVTGLCEYFDGIYTSHEFGFAKERQEFWQALQEETNFDPETTMFVDDSHPVLASSATYGVKHPVAISRPDTSRPSRDSEDFVSVEGLAELI
ncbi:MAG: GMP/IMP nucleotidase [Woeseiaceae bacterium]